MDFEKHAFSIGFITGLFLSYLDIQLAHYLQSLLWPVWSPEMNEVDLINLVKAVEALAKPNCAEWISAISVVVAAALALWQFKENSDLDFNREAIKSLNTFYHDAFSFIYDEDMESPINKRENWSLASDSIKLADKHYNNLKKNHLKENAKLEVDKWKKMFLVHLEQGDPKKSSLRMQFFTGLKEWQNNNDSMDELIKNEKLNIGSSFNKFDEFGNTDKGGGINNIAIENIITVYAFMLGYEEIKVEDLKKVWIVEPEKHNHIWPKDSCKGFHRFFLDFFKTTEPK